MKAEEFDRRFDAGEDMSEFFDLSKARRPNQEKQKIELHLSITLIRKLEAQAEAEGISLQVYLENHLTQQLSSVA
jgi:hypothetical protein